MTGENSQTNPHADREKKGVALGSVLAAMFLTLVKLIVGVMTGSLGILAEVAHSGLDLVAAVVTLFAVRVSGKPADSEHTYGHGKIENLSALFETLLLLITCVWIIYEAIQRLFFKSVVVEASIWGFAVMIIAIGVDIGRSRALARVARKYHSQALEADALHFSTDVWSSTVVIVGLSLVKLSEWLHTPWLAKADAVAALGVAGIVIYVSVQLGRRTIAGLLDEVPSEMRAQITEAVRVPGVVAVERVRVRRSGPEAFADVTLKIGRGMPLEQAHDIASRAEAAVQELLPGADVTVHVEPVHAQDENVPDTVRLLAARRGLSAHDIRAFDVLGHRSLELHLEVADSLRLDEAHAQATALEEALRQALPGIGRIVTHIEPRVRTTQARQATAADEARLRNLLRAFPSETGIDCHPHDVVVQRVAGELTASFHCALNAGATIADAHALTEQMEQTLHQQVPNLSRVVIHVEPQEAKD